MRRSGCRTSGTHDHVQTPLGEMMDHHSRAKRVAASLPKDQVLVTLREIDDTEMMMWTERVLWPRAGMAIQHAMMERVHAGLPEESGWNKPELEPRVAIVAKRSGYCTMFAYVPLPTQFLIQLPESESSNGKSSLLARGMDYYKIGYIHNGEGWVRQTGIRSVCVQGSGTRPSAESVTENAFTPFQVRHSTDGPHQRSRATMM